jgi:hypothetical protein
MTAENKSKITWNIINNELVKVKNNNHTPLRFTSGKTSFQLDSAVEAFNDYFLNVVEKLNMEKVDINSALLSLNNFFSRDFPDSLVNSLVNL